MEEDCVFCKIAKGEVKDRKIKEDENFFVVDDIKPITRGHKLIISKKHYKTILDIPSLLGSELLAIEKETALKLMKDDKTIEGFNVINNNFSAAGQVVHHVHVHLIPRRKDDGLKIFN